MAVTVDAVGPSSSGALASVSGPYTLSWTHTGTSPYGLVFCGVGTPIAVFANFTVTCTWGGVACTEVGRMASGGGSSTAGGFVLFKILNAPVAGGQTVTFTVTGAGLSGTAELEGGSVSYLGAAGFGAGFTSFSATSVTSGSITGTGTDPAGLMAAGYVNGTNGTNTWTLPAVRDFYAAGPNTSGSGNCAGGHTASAGGSVSIAWAQPSDTYGAVGVEVLSPQPAAVIIQPPGTWRQRFRPGRRKFVTPLGPPPSGAAAVSDADACAGADAEAVGIQLPTVIIQPPWTWRERFGPSTGRPQEKLQLPVYWGPLLVSGSDAGTGADGGEAVAATLADSDSGTGTDGGESIAVTLASSDAGHGSDSGEAIAATLAGSDAGSGADGGEAAGILLPTVTALVSKTWLERWRTQRRWLITQTWQPQAYTDADYCTGTDAGTSVSLSDSDGSSAADAGTIGLSSSDAAAGSDTTGTIALAAADTGSGTDAGESIAATLSDTDAGLGTDAEAVGILLPSPTVTAQVPRTWLNRWRPYRHWQVLPLYPGPLFVPGSDAGTGADGGEAVAATLASQDAAGSTDQGTTVGIGAAESAAGSDTTGTIALSGTDGGSTAEAGSVAATLADGDASAGTDGGELTARQDLLLLVQQVSRTWRSRFRRPVVPFLLPPPPVTVVPVADAEACLGEDAEIDNPYPVSADTADAGRGTDGGEQLAVLVSSAAFTSDASFSSEAEAVHQDGDAGTGTDSGYPSAAVFTQSDAGLGFDQEKALLQESSADAGGAGADGGEVVAVLGTDACTGTDPEVLASAPGVLPAVPAQVPRTWLLRFRRRGQAPLAFLSAAADGDAGTGADGGEAIASTGTASSDACPGRDAELLLSASFRQPDSSLAFDTESAVFGPNAAPSDPDACTGTETQIIDVYAFQPPFRWTGGGFELRPGPPQRPPAALQVRAEARPALQVTVEITGLGK